MRSARLLTLAVLAVTGIGGCAGGARSSTGPTSGADVTTPARDLAAARAEAPRADPADPGLVAKDPRVVDLDIIRIRASSSGVGGDPELTSVASADLFRAANAAAAAGNHQEAIGGYRQLMGEFPGSLYAPVALFNIAALHDKHGDVAATIATLQELVATYPGARESIEGHLYIAALQAEKARWPEARATLDAVLARQGLTYADLVEAHARRGYVLLEQRQLEGAEASLDAALAAWRKAPRIDDVYYIAMAHYYRGELAHQRFLSAPVRAEGAGGDDQMVADLEQKRVFAVQAYDRWKQALGFKHAYWATAAGYQMSQIFRELWDVHVLAPYPRRIAVATRPTYVREVHDRVREHLEKALEGHRMNVELAKAFGVETTWSQGSEAQAVRVLELLAREASGRYVTPEP